MRLLIKRLLRSQVKGGALVALFLGLVILSTSLCVMLWEHTRNAELVYDDFYGETNLGDVFVNTLPGWSYDKEGLIEACEAAGNSFVGTDLEILHCDTKYIHREEFIRPDGVNVTLIVHGLEQNYSINKPWYLDSWGEFPEDDGVVIDKHVYDSMGIEIGETATLVLGGKEVEFEVTGIANHPEHMWYTANPGELVMAQNNLAVVYMPIESLLTALDENLSNRNVLLIDVNGTPEYDLLDTTSNEGERLSELRSELDDELEAAGYDKVLIGDRGGIWSVEAMRQDLEGSKKSTPVFLILLAGIASMVISISLDRLVKRQSREIAVLRTVGVKSPPLLISYLSIPAFHGLVGGILGVYIGRMWSTGFTAWYFDFISGMPVTVERHHNDVAVIVLVSVMVILLLFGMWPSRRAAKLSPLDVMREQSGAVPNLFVTWATAWMPPSISLGFRSTFRNPGRLAMTTAGLGLALILVSGMSMVTEGMMQWIKETQETDTWDTMVNCDPLDNQDLRTWVEERSELYESEWSLQVPINASGDTRIMTLHAMEAFSEDGIETMHASRLESGRLPVSGGSTPEVIVDMGVARFLEWEIGQNVEVLLGITEMKFKVVGVVNEPTRSVWVHHSDVTEDLGVLGETMHNVLFIRNIGEANATSDKSLKQVDSVNTITDKQMMIKMMDESFKDQEELWNQFIFFGALIAIAVLLNTLMINITEHDNEFATLRTLGASSPRLLSIMLFEHLVIGVIGGVFGAFASMGAAKAMGAAFTNWAFTFEIPVQWDIAVYTAIAVVVASVAIVPIGIFRVRKMDLVEVAKSQ